jgi:hypothetical protein
VRLARVVRRARAISPVEAAAEPRGDARLVVELGEARVVVPHGFDAATLGAVLQVLGARQSGGEK